MSLEIDVDKISEVLLADGWHKVSTVGDGRSSFGTDSYHFLQPKPEAEENSATETEEGQSKEVQIPQDRSKDRGEDSQKNSPGPAGARWTESDGSRVFCPVTSILAVKYAAQKKS